MNIPHLPDKGSHKVLFDPSNLYIDGSDFREVCIVTQYKILTVFHFNKCLVCMYLMCVGDRARIQKTSSWTASWAETLWLCHLSRPL